MLASCTKQTDLICTDRRKKKFNKLLTRKQKSVKLDLSSRDKDSRTKHLENFQKTFQKGLDNQVTVCYNVDSQRQQNYSQKKGVFKMTQKEKAALLRQYHAAKIAADKAKAIGKEIKNAMAEEGEKRWEVGGFIASVSTYESKSFDADAFKRDYPDLYEQYMVKKPQTRLNFK